MSTKSILIVEDDLDNQELLKEIIDSCPEEYSHYAVADGEEAISKLENNDYDLVFMDVSIPKKDGYEIVKHVRKSSAGAQVPIVALTAHAMKGVKEKVLDSGFNEYLAKPCTPRDLKQVISRYLEKTLLS